MRGLALLLVGLLVLPACGGARPTKPWPEQQARRNEITVLWAQIRDWRRDAGMEVEPDESAVMAMSRMTVSTAAKACVLQQAPRPACSEASSLPSVRAWSKSARACS